MATDDPFTATSPEPAEAQTVPLAEERLVVEKVEHGRTVRVSTRTREHQVEVDEMLTSVRAEVTRVPIDRVVDTVPEVEERDGVTVIPVLEEVLVRQLVLREELHVRRVTEPRAHRETVTLRAQEPVVERFDDT